MFDMKQDFTHRERLLFGPLFALFAAIIAGILVQRFALTRLAGGWGIVAALIIVVYYLVPGWQETIYRGWLRTLAPVGWVVAHGLLVLVYGGIVTPMGLALRVSGYDPLSRRADRTATTYWIPRTTKTNAPSYFRQY